MKVHRLVFREVDAQQDAVTRPYRVNEISGQDISLLAEATMQGQMLNSSNLSGLSSRLVTPSAESHGVARIDNGWGESRLHWMMVVETLENRHQVKLRVLSGYTDYLGVTVTGQVDPEMRMYINNSLEINNTLSVGRRGQQWASSIRDVNQVVMARPDQALESTVLLRPQDLFTRKVDVVGGGYSNVTDLRSTMNSGALKYSMRRNSNPTDYLSRVLKASANSMDVTGFISEDDNDSFHSAAGYVREQDVITDAIMDEIRRDSDILYSGFMQFGDLLNMAGNETLDDRVEINFLDRRSATYNRQDMERWQSATPDAMAALYTANAITPILMDLMYASVRFRATNDTLGGQVTVAIERLTPFVPDIDPNIYFGRLVSNIEVDIMREITLNGQRLVDLEVIADVLGDTKIIISIDGDSPRVYGYPTFADSLITPVIGTGIRDLDNLAVGLTSLLSEIQSEYAPTQTSPLLI